MNICKMKTNKQSELEELKEIKHNILELTNIA